MSSSREYASRMFHQSAPIIGITGSIGLIGRLVSHELTKRGYIIYGIDNAPEGTVSERFKMDDEKNNPLLTKPFPGKEFFVADITDKDKLRSTMMKIGRIDVLIHLAAALETQPPETIKHVNEIGTQNIYEICKEFKINKVIIASSIMTVWDIFTNESPYKDIYQQTFKGRTADIPSIKPKLREPTVKNENVGFQTYINSKIHNEKLAQKFVAEGISTLCARICWVNAKNAPFKPNISSIWLSWDDLCQFFIKAVDFMVKAKEDMPFANIYFACSDNEFRWVDIEDARKDLGYVPKDCAKAILEKRVAFEP